MKILLVKRLESSFFAFKNSIDRFSEHLEIFIETFENGSVYISKGYSNKILELLASDNPEAINKLIEENNIVVDKETLKKEIEDKSKSFKDPEQYVNWIYGNEEQLKNIESLVLEDKVAEYLENKSKVEEELLSFEEIVSMG